MPAPKGHPPFAGCEKGGRPIKYTKEFIESEAEAFLAWMSKENSIWYKDFALERGYLPDQLSEWARINEKFSACISSRRLGSNQSLAKGVC